MQVSRGVSIVVQLMLDIIALVLTPRRGLQRRRGIGVGHSTVPCSFGRSTYRSLIAIKFPHSHSFIARNTMLLRIEVWHHAKANHYFPVGSSQQGLSNGRGKVGEEESF